MGFRDGTAMIASMPSSARRAADACSRLLGGVTVALTLALLVVVLWQVLSRYLFNNPSVVTEDLVKVLLPWVGLLGAAWTYGQGRQLAIELLPSRLSGRSARNLHIVIRGAAVVFAVTVMVVGGAVYTYDRLQRGQLTEVLRFPVGIIYLAAPISGLLIAGFALADIADLLAGRCVPGMTIAEETTEKMS